MTKISACLVIYNEEMVIRRCLENIKDVVDDIIIVHDGKCKDKTLDICKKYTNKIYIFKHIGNAETHRPKAFKLARNNWILSIDADEMLSTSLKRFLNNFKENNKITRYEFIWRNHFTDVSFTYDTKKIFLLNRKKLNTPKVVIVSEELHFLGNVKKMNLVVNHMPFCKLFSLKKRFKKEYKWAKMRAKGLIKTNKVKLPAFLYLIKAPITGILAFRENYKQSKISNMYYYFICSSFSFFRYFIVFNLVFWYKVTKR